MTRFYLARLSTVTGNLVEKELEKALRRSRGDEDSFCTSEEFDFEISFNTMKQTATQVFSRSMSIV